MRIGILGTRGVPASYSGFETCAENLGKRLVARGHSVVVYCRLGRSANIGGEYLGMRRVMLPTLPTKASETMSHTLLSVIHAGLFSRLDAVLLFGVGNAVYCDLLRAFGIPVAINVDGADWSRLKWGGIGRGFLKWSERVAARRANAVIADARSVASYYLSQYRTSTDFIPYGAEVPEQLGTRTLERFNLQPRQYLLAVGRLVPENGFHHLVDAYAAIAPDMPFVIVGDAPYSDAYKRQLRKMAPPQVVFTGYQFGVAYHELSANSYAFLFGAEVGGTHPVLVEQLAHGSCIVARWTQSNTEVAGDAALFFRTRAELIAALSTSLADYGLVERMRGLARDRSQNYSWERVTDQYEDLLRTLVDAAASTPRGTRE